MKYCNVPNDERLKVEFQRRLKDLCEEIKRYQETGHMVISSLYSFRFTIICGIMTHIQ